MAMMSRGVSYLVDFSHGYSGSTAICAERSPHVVARVFEGHLTGLHGSCGGSLDGVRNVPHAVLEVEGVLLQLFARLTTGSRGGEKRDGGACRSAEHERTEIPTKSIRTAVRGHGVAPV